MSRAFEVAKGGAVSFPYNPPGHIPGQHVPGTTVPIPYAMEQAQRYQQAMAQSQQAAIAARLQRMRGRWFTPEHTWVAVDGEVATVGITDHAYQLFSNILFVSLPGPGATLTAGGACGQVEGSRSVSDLYAPVDGTVTGVNQRLDTEPELINDDPYGEGWMFRLAVGPGAAASLREGMLSPAEYEELTRKAR